MANTENTLQLQDVHLSEANIFSSKNAFDLACRMAKAFSESTIVPKAYQGNISNCLIALEMAGRIGTSPMMVMQNLYIVNGTPSWSSQFIVAMINNSKKYKTELQFELTGEGDSLACTAYTFDYEGRKVSGPTITMEMAKAEGWVQKNGSKWKTMPEVMIRYRAASFFGRINCPDMIMGIYTEDEVQAMTPIQVVDAIEMTIDDEIKEKANAIVIGDTADVPAAEVVPNETEAHDTEGQISMEDQQSAKGTNPATPPGANF